MEELLQVKNLKTAFKTKKQSTEVVHGVNFEVNKGEIVGVVGESGCGKSVTSLSIMRLFHGTQGSVEAGEINYKNENLLDFSERDMRKIRGKQISMIFQEPMSSLNPVMKIGKQMTQGIMLHLKISRQKAKQQAVDMLKAVGIPRADKIMKEYPHQLSGGMCQRVMIAMSMSCKPELLIADEPTTALDVTIQAQILELMRNLRKENNTAILFITHDLGVVAEVCDRVVVMYAGTVVEEGTVQELFNHPKHPYTKGLIGSAPKLGSLRERLDAIEGQVPSPDQMPKGCKFAPRCPHVMDICWQKEPELVTDDDQHKHRCWLYQDHDSPGQEKSEVTQKVGDK